MGQTIKVDFSEKPEIEPLGSGTVFTVKSTSEPGKSHVLAVYTDDDGYPEWVCSCSGYQFNGLCWHVKKIRERHGL